MLNEAQRIDEIRVEGISVPTGGKSGDEEQEEEEEEEEDSKDIHVYAARLTTYVEGSLRGASGSKRDTYKDNMVYQARKDLISTFNKIAMVKKCSNCRA